VASFYGRIYGRNTTGHTEMDAALWCLLGYYPFFFQLSSHGQGALESSNFPLLELCRPKHPMRGTDSCENPCILPSLVGILIKISKVSLISQYATCYTDKNTCRCRTGQEGINTQAYGYLFFIFILSLY
jgi:hypothetical protein